MDPLYIYATAGLIVLTILSQVFRKGFDPFAPLWLFFVGYVQIYVIQALMYRDYALRVRGPELTAAANFRALWALAWFLAVYFFGPSRVLSGFLPRPPRGWSTGLLTVLTPVMVLWGLFCAGLALRIEDRTMSDEENLIHSFPLVLLVAGIWILVTGRNADRPRPGWSAVGVAITAAYVFIWMFNGKRSHSLIGVLTGVCAWYIPRYRRPSKVVLLGTAFLGALAVSVAIGWRNQREFERNASGFVQFLSNFSLDSILVNINLKDGEERGPAGNRPVSYETEEYGGYLLMMDAVPEKSDYDYGLPYLRLVSTFIPRLVWPDKPLFGREKWIAAWQASSEFKRESNFTGPAIGVLGALQLNGGATGTFIMMTVLALIIRSSYEYFRRYADVPWVQAWWTLTFYNAWFMVVTDDPFVWFYYNYGFTTFVPMAALWCYNKFLVPDPPPLPDAGWEGNPAQTAAPDCEFSLDAGASWMFPQSTSTSHA